MREFEYNSENGVTGGASRGVNSNVLHTHWLVWIVLLCAETSLVRVDVVQLMCTRELLVSISGNHLGQ